MTRAMTVHPCRACPFRTDVPIYLRANRRADIARTLLGGGDFPCHSTVTYSEGGGGEEEHDLSKAQFCSGAAKSLLEAGLDNQILRIMERLGMIDLDAVQASGIEVWDIHTWQTLQEGDTYEERAEEDEEIETCAESGPTCIAPAGWLEGGGVVHGTEAADGRCDGCYEPLCSECADENGNCSTCARYFE